MSRLVIGLLLLALAACSPAVDGTELGGVAQWYGATPAPALSAANTHCQRYGRVARVSQIQTWGGYLAFSCDRPDRS